MNKKQIKNKLMQSMRCDACICHPGPEAVTEHVGGIVDMFCDQVLKYVDDGCGRGTHEEALKNMTVADLLRAAADHSELTHGDIPLQDTPKPKKKSCQSCSCVEKKGQTCHA